MKSYLHEMVTSYWSVKVFSFESFPLYGDLMKDLFLLIHFMLLWKFSLRYYLHILAKFSFL